MADIDTTSHKLADALKSQEADYIEVRVAESRTGQVMYRGKQLESIGRTTTIGGSVRALVNGGWGFVSFNDFDDIAGKVALAVKQARFVGNETSLFAPVDPVVEVVPCTIGENPVTIPLADKKALLDEYNDIIWATDGIQTSNIGYSDGHKRVIFLNSEGSRIEQERTDVTLRVVAVAAKDGEVQQVGISIGGRDDFTAVRNLHSRVEELANKAVSVLSAPKVKGGEYTVVLDPVLAGVFVHEAFGHLSEADFVHENERLREIMTMGKTFGGSHLNIVDTASIPGLRGSYKYDDEGVLTKKNYLIREGKLVGRLHSRETAARMNETPTGNARAISYRHPPIVRMSNTYIEPGSTTFDDMIADIKEGVYVRNWYGGTTSMEMFTFSAGEAYMIRNGKIAEMVRPVVLTGNVFSTLENLDAIGDDLDMNQGGGCGKGAQSPLPVSNGSPHIRIQRCLVGGN
ncbi:MAG TPA: TldD/PmbA family protein [Dehalococcoidia bacterium]|nr:TldD/PmbA family protein [Dehalococcoidia bacterium]